jgi:hypothetical protein
VFEWWFFHVFIGKKVSFFKYCSGKSEDCRTDDFTDTYTFCRFLAYPFGNALLPSVGIMLAQLSWVK